MGITGSYRPGDNQAYVIRLMHENNIYTVWHENLTVIKFYGLPELLH